METHACEEKKDKKDGPQSFEREKNGGNKNENEDVEENLYEKTETEIKAFLIGKSSYIFL